MVAAVLGPHRLAGQTVGVTLIVILLDFSGNIGGRLDLFVSCDHVL